MTDAHDRGTDEPTRDVRDPAHGSSAYTGQPLADQPTEVVPLDRYEARDDTPPAGLRPLAVPPVPDDEPYATPRDEGRHRTDAPDDDPRDRTNPEYTAAPVAVRRADSVAGLLLVLAGIAAGVSLLLVWVRGGDTGLDLVRGGIADAVDGTVWSSGSWQVLAVVFGGAVLFLLGLLMYVPAKTHRFLGVLALLVSLAVAAGVLVPLADADWDISGFDVGFWFTVAVGGLGLLGTLKALSTGQKVSRRR
ncbi:hypothetical protein SAMN05661080_00242 [Modestobacter sp. DSM 44400]|uniref:hypothetical protein n=1 Tax=Modestobacter sp. DSM 44400 TaxID=1550230 RepID=UPI000897B7D6|nr:hypothetical protein [Modestobacter sp. DSM 44400]SDX50918.1 hypothetical protein SAMN05661080_00242 [Modestobacter sp. DSM 44400]